MENQQVRRLHDGMSERELAEKIIHLHDDLGKGFRRIARELASQGYKANKDSANKLYNKYKASADVGIEEDKELEQLRIAENRARQQVEFKKEKEEILNRLNIFFVENITMTFEQRKMLFTDRERLLRFAKKVMPKVDPLLWDQFQDHCYEGEIKLAHAISTALGKQADYEIQTNEDAKGRRRFDLYLQQRLAAVLQRWTMPDPEKSQIQEESELAFSEGENEEYVTITIPSDAPLY